MERIYIYREREREIKSSILTKRGEYTRCIQEGPLGPTKKAREKKEKSTNQPKEAPT